MIVAGLTQPEADELAAQKEAELAVEAGKRELAEIDAAAIRPLLAIVAGIDTKEDRDKVKELAEKAKATRARKA